MLVPHGVWILILRWLSQRDESPLPVALLRANSELKNQHYGERCFILGNGPSVKEMDLLLLEGENIISVSNGYLHNAYDRIQPRYHCVPQITYGRMTENDVVLWFGEMHERIGDAILFLNETEMDLVKRKNLFPEREVHYVALRENFDELQERNIINLSGPIPRVESVPVMALMVAMYLGFRDIFLLGVDHDHFKSGSYVYAFELQVQKNKDFSVTKDGSITTSRYDDFQSLARLWRQYRVVRQIAEHNGIRIFNATPGGELDEFSRITLDDALRGMA